MKYEILDDIFLFCFNESDNDGFDWFRKEVSVGGLGMKRLPIFLIG